MDIARTDSKVKLRKRWLIAGGVLIVVVVTPFALSAVGRKSVDVERGSLWIDSVKRGPMLRQVRGNGVLVPEEVRWIPALTAGRVEKIRIWPGTAVSANDVILELSEPQQMQEARDAALRLRAAEANLLSLRSRLHRDRLEQEAVVAKLYAEMTQAKLRADADEELARNGLLSAIQQKVSRSAADELANRHALERRRLDATIDSISAELEAQSAGIDQLRAVEALARERVSSLQVRAGIDGVLQQLNIEVGQRIEAGGILGKVARPDKLKAQLKIPETQARDIQPGQIAQIDTRHGIAQGRVQRVDPAVQEGTVTVDVTFDAPLPRGSRPDLAVDGAIELERLANALFIGRPAGAEEESTVQLFRLVDDDEAERVEVRLGRASSDMVEVRSGLAEGEQIVLSQVPGGAQIKRIRIR